VELLNLRMQRGKAVKLRQPYLEPPAEKKA
jgi:hypothetical protein